eukprot:9272061-Lingulodinium_polyedra.AAC.1
MRRCPRFRPRPRDLVARKKSRQRARGALQRCSVGEIRPRRGASRGLRQLSPSPPALYVWC